jgi:histidine triad (HIT) family protein
VRAGLTPGLTRVNTEADCIFCGIVAGTRPCHKVLETDAVLSIMDIFPASEGLVIPKQHCETVFDISESDMQAVSIVARRVAVAIRAELSADGMTITQVNGAAAGQTVMHYHVHLLPRTQGESMRLRGSRQADPARLEALSRAFAARL